MTKASKKQTTSKSNYLKLGAALFLIWPILTALFSGHLFFCGLMSSTPCADSGNWQDILVLGPTVIGGFLLSVGVLYDSNMDRSLKAVVVTFLGLALAYAAYWLTGLWLVIELSLGTFFQGMK